MGWLPVTGCCLSPTPRTLASSAVGSSAKHAGPQRPHPLPGTGPRGDSRDVAQPSPQCEAGDGSDAPPNTGLWDQMPPANVDRELHEDEAS